MPPFEIMDLHQTAVLWEKSTTGYGVDLDGEPKVQSPVNVACRWEWGRRDTVNAQGDTIAIDATVIVKQEIAIGSAMVLGTIATLTGSETKLKVATSSIVGDIKNRNTRYELGLNRHGDVVPELES